MSLICSDVGINYLLDLALVSIEMAGMEPRISENAVVLGVPAECGGTRRVCCLI